MSESVNLPALGESVTEGTVTRWLKKVGDRVEIDEPLLEVSTDKVDTEIPSPVSGIIEQILVNEDETAEVGTPLVIIGDNSRPSSPVEAPPAAAEVPAPAEQLPTPAAESVEAVNEPETLSAAPAVMVSDIPQEQTTETTSTTPAQSYTNASYLTPLVRKLASDNGINCETLTGTGVGGRIRKEDVLAAIAQKNMSPLGSASETTHAERAVDVLAHSELRGTTAPMSRLRKVIADRAVASLQSTAQLTSVVEVDVTRVADLRNSVKTLFAEKTGVKLSFLPFFALAAVEALKKYPIINATVEGENIIYPNYENLSIAVDTERGLLTPVVRDAGSLNIAGFAQEISDLALRTRENKLKPDELVGGTFTLTNTGSRGALFDTPIVFLPQVAILGTGVVTKKPVVVESGTGEAIAVRSTVYLALSYDHRIVDGADAARFLTEVKNRLETADFSADLGI